MVFFLTEHEKLLILIFASSLFLLSILITVCVVSPICLLNKWIFRSSHKKQDAKICSIKSKLFEPESKHFQLSVVPHYYGSSEDGMKLKSNGFQESAFFDTKTTPNKESNKELNGDSLQQNEPQPKIKFETCLETINENTIKLHLNLDQVQDLHLREYGVEPSCYVSVELLWYGGRSRRKSLTNNKPHISSTYRTASAKRCLNPVFNEIFTCPQLPKSILKEGRLNIKVYDDERYANDICLGELSIPLKKLSASFGEMKTYQLNPPKECKGSLLYGVCYLPTSKRVTITMVKATLTNPIHASPNICYYIRILMFINGKLIKKKKSATSQKLIWGEQETLTFDLTANNGAETSFMIVLSSRADSSNGSPSSPETPVTPDTSNDSRKDSNDSRKDRHIGHFIIGKEFWAQMKQQPRKPIMKWSKLY